jgi:hypothetical protein
VLERLSGREYAIAAAGSLSNTLLGLARLSQANSAAWGDAPLRVGMAGLVGSDPLGEYYTAQMRQAGVQVTATPLEGAATGTVTVLTSPDAQRTMLSYLGTAAEVAVDAALEAAIARSRLLVVEGYLWELPNAQRTITAVSACLNHDCGPCLPACLRLLWRCVLLVGRSFACREHWRVAGSAASACTACHGTRKLSAGLPLSARFRPHSAPPSSPPRRLCRPSPRRSATAVWWP